MDASRKDTDDGFSRAQAGDAQAFGALFQAAIPRLETYIRLRMSQETAAELDPADVLQETGLRAFQSISSFRPQGPGAFQRWLCAIAENRLRDAAEFRQALKRQPPGEREAISVALDRALHSATGPGTAAGRDERNETLRRLLLELDGVQRQALVLRFFRGATTAQIANELGCSETSARRHLTRGTAALGEALGEGDGF